MRDDKLVTWRELLTIAMAEDTQDTWTDVVNIAGDIDTAFYDGFGCAEGPPFTVWSKRYVYFPVEYDGAEKVGFVLREPCDTATEHI